MKRTSPEQFQEELERIVDNLRAYRPRRIILYGSFARGDYHASSDVGLVIIKDTDRPFFKRMGDVLALCDSSLVVEPRVYTPEESERLKAQHNPFIEQVLEEGKVIYES